MGARVWLLRNLLEDEAAMELAMIEPVNFGVVFTGLLYRSAYPSAENYTFLKKLGLKSVVYLCMEPYSNQSFLDENGITLFQFGMEGKKQAVPEEVVRKALKVVIDARNYPLLIHCNAGKHRTGCVVGCLRKIQNWNIANILEEYLLYSREKSRKADEEMIKAFDATELRMRSRILSILRLTVPMRSGTGVVLTDSVTPSQQQKVRG